MKELEGTGMKAVGSGSVKLGLMVLLVSFLALCVYPQGYPGHDAATAGASTGSSGYSRIWGNPASWSCSDKICFGQYFHHRYMMKELAVKGLGVVLPAGKGAFGATWLSEGFNLIRKHDVGLGYSRGFGKKVRAGVKFHYLSIALSENYGRCSGSAVSAGFRAFLSPSLEAGTSIFYPVGNNLNIERSFQPGILSGLSWKVSRDLEIITEISKEALSPVKLSCSLSYSGSGFWVVQSGLNFYPVSCYAGAGFTTHRFTFLLNTGYHSLLGFSPTAIILYEKH